MIDKEYLGYCNPKNWDKDTWVGGMMVLACMAVSCFVIVIFH